MRRQTRPSARQSLKPVASPPSPRLRHHHRQNHHHHRLRYVPHQRYRRHHYHCHCHYHHHYCRRRSRCHRRHLHRRRHPLLLHYRSRVPPPSSSSSPLPSSSSSFSPTRKRLYPTADFVSVAAIESQFTPFPGTISARYVARRRVWSRRANSRKSATAIFIGNKNRNERRKVGKKGKEGER